MTSYVSCPWYCKWSFWTGQNHCHNMPKRFSITIMATWCTGSQHHYVCQYILSISQYMLCICLCILCTCIFSIFLAYVSIFVAYVSIFLAHVSILLNMLVYPFLYSWGQRKGGREIEGGIVEHTGLKLFLSVWETGWRVALCVHKRICSWFTPPEEMARKNAPNGGHFPLVWEWSWWSYICKL